MHKIFPYLQLCRFAAVFTALADIFLGYLLTHRDLSRTGEFGLLLLASAGLYLSGMVFNDVFDRVIDASERPNRPIPSGRVPLGYALSFGGGLMAVGFFAAVANGWQSAIVAFALIWGIFLYDGFLKSTPLGPLVMGACRFLNVMLGASTALDPLGDSPTFASVWNHPQLHVAVGMGTYIVGVTWFARREATVSSRWSLLAAAMVVNLGLIFQIAFVLHWHDDEMAQRSWNAALMLAAIGVIIDRRLLGAVFDPVPAKVQLGVRTLLLSIVMIDAALVFFANEDRLYAFSVALLLVPATALAKYLAVT